RLRGKAGMGVRAEGARERARRPACPHPNPPPQAGEGAVRRRLLTTSPAYGGRPGWGRAEGARKVARQPDCPPPSPPPQAGEGAIRRRLLAPSPACGGRLGWGRAEGACRGSPTRANQAIRAAPGKPRNQEWLAE